MPPRKRHHFVMNRDGNGKPDGTYHCATCRAEQQQNERSKGARRGQEK